MHKIFSYTIRVNAFLYCSPRLSSRKLGLNTCPYSGSLKKEMKKNLNINHFYIESKNIWEPLIFFKRTTSTSVPRVLERKHASERVRLYRQQPSAASFRQVSLSRSLFFIYFFFFLLFFLILFFFLCACI